MNTITIIPDPDESGTRYRAVSGRHQSVGRTMGEALDTLAAQIEDTEVGTLVLIQRRQPDRFFSADQYERMHDLLARRDSLTEKERTELESLVDAELDATIARTEALAQQIAA